MLSQVLNISNNGGSITSMANLFWCFTMLIVKRHFFLCLMDFLVFLFEHIASSITEHLWEETICLIYTLPSYIYIRAWAFSLIGMVDQAWFCLQKPMVMTPSQLFCPVSVQKWELHIWSLFLWKKPGWPVFIPWNLSPCSSWRLQCY